MDNKEFKKHLQDLAHGHHHPEEHDWSPGSNVRKAGESVGANGGKPSKTAVRSKKRRAK